MSDLPGRLADGITTYSKTIILVVLLATIAIGAGAPMVEQESDTGQFETESEAANAQEYIQQNLTSGEGENQTTIQVVQQGENVLSQESLLESLRFQQTLRETESINKTLLPGGVFGVENIIARQAFRQSLNDTDTLLRVLNDTDTRQQILNSTDGSRQILNGTGVPPGARNDTDTLEQFLNDTDLLRGFLSDVETRQRLINNTDIQPTLDQQITVMEEIDAGGLDRLIQSVLAEDGSQAALGLMPSGGSAAYEPGSPNATARLTVITQQTQGGAAGPSGFAEPVTEAQLEMRDIAGEQDSQYTVFGVAIITEEINQSLGDSGAIVGPLALLFVVLALTIAYRDLLDIIFGVLGIVAVLVWTFGFMGWVGISFNQLLLSVPVLLIGLSIDYAIHVFMRHREQRAETEDDDLRASMTVALAGVGAALVWVTATAAIGFLANLTSPIGPLRDFGIVSAFGVVAALVIFGVLIPALKVEVDGFLERLGLNRKKSAFGTGGSVFSKVLASGAVAARRAPAVVIVLAAVITVGGIFGATQVDTSFNQEDFLAEEPPEWTQNLPEPFAPGTYQAKEDLGFIQDNFQQEGRQGELLIRGNTTDSQTLQWMDNATTIVGEKNTTFLLATGQPQVRTPLSVMQETAAENPNSTFARTFAASTGDDDVPDENITTLYDQVLELNPDASTVIYRTPDGQYEALRITVGLQGSAGTADAASDLRASADAVEEDSGGRLDVVATGEQVVFNEVEKDLLATVIQGLIITLVAVFIFLAVAYRLTGSQASLGLVTLLPVLLAVAWILGSMWVLDIPFNTLTGTITSLTIGLGIAYSIHISSRYELELRRQGDVWEALETTVTGTGGALLGSAATTVGGFGTLVFAILPVLQQFGIITGLTIIYAFLASVLVLPSLLVVWTRYFGPSGYFPPHDESETPEGAEQAAADGGPDVE
jgi:predicted RND superfamily exporter protein